METTFDTTSMDYFYFPYHQNENETDPWLIYDFKFYQNIIMKCRNELKSCHVNITDIDSLIRQTSAFYESNRTRIVQPGYTEEKKEFLCQIRYVYTLIKQKFVDENQEEMFNHIFDIVSHSMENSEYYPGDTDSDEDEEDLSVNNQVTFEFFPMSSNDDVNIYVMEDERND